MSTPLSECLGFKPFEGNDCVYAASASATTIVSLSLDPIASDRLSAAERKDAGCMNLAGRTVVVAVGLLLCVPTALIEAVARTLLVPIGLLLYAVSCCCDTDGQGIKTLSYQIIVAPLLNLEMAGFICARVCVIFSQIFCCCCCWEALPDTTPQPSGTEGDTEGASNPPNDPPVSLSTDGATEGEAAASSTGTEPPTEQPVDQPPAEEAAAGAPAQQTASA